MTTALEAHQAIAEAAAKPMTELRMMKAIAVGEWIRQGDCYLIRVAKKPAGLIPTKNRQLAAGTTQGSRHIVLDGPEIFVHTGNTDPLVGPVIVANERFILDHPEHAVFSLPAGTYQCRLQQDWAEQERRAVRD
jgi:hypothetical protein